MNEECVDYLVNLQAIKSWGYMIISNWNHYAVTEHLRRVYIITLWSHSVLENLQSRDLIIAIV